MAARIYLIMGATGSGKSTLLKCLTEIHNFKYTLLTKLTTRRRRKDEGVEIKPVDTESSVHISKTSALIKFVQNHSVSYKYDTASEILTLKGPMPFEEKQEILNSIADNENDKLAVETLYQEANVIPAGCDFVYEQFTYRYGLATNDILKGLKENLSPVVIVNDIRTLKDIKGVFGPLAVCIFLYRNIEDREIHNLQEKRGAIDASGKLDERQIRRRIGKICAMFRKYIENIYLFDHVILNTTTEEDMLRQMKKIVSTDSKSNKVTFVMKEDLYV